ncbi:peptidoglycan DD-metalloendopeptidase family protein [bacterium]|nr:peptidoglycan DD-metalloendopeptidase family protein [bacterium]
MRTGRAVLAGALLAAVVAAPASADLNGELSEVRNRVDSLRSQVSGTEGERSDLAGSILDTAARLDVLSAELAESGAALAETEAEIGGITATVSLLDDSIDRRETAVVDLQSRVGSSREAALRRVVQLYMAADSAGINSLVVEDVQQTTVGAVYAERIEAMARAEIARFESLRRSEEQAVARLAVERTERADQIATLESQRALRQARADDVAARTGAVQSLLAEQVALLAQMDAEIAEIEGEISSLEREQDRIQELIRIESSTGGTRPQGILVRPVAGGVSSGFGPRIHPIYGTVRMHTGVDMNASCGVEIRAAEAGRVFLADWKGGYGLTVMIDHGGGMSTLYAHQTITAVGYGQQVQRGQVIGYAGTTGTSTACHLHFEVRLGGAPVDPAPYL